MVDLDRPELGRLLRPSPKQRQSVLFIVMLLLILVGVFVLIPAVWLPALQKGGLIYAIVDIGVTSGGLVTHWSVYLLLLGMLFGGAILWFFDSFKYIQAVILWVGLLVSLVLFSLRWEESIESGLLTGWLLFAVGAVVVVQFSGVPLLERYTQFGHDKKRLLTRPPRNFTRAVKFTAGFVFVFAGLGLLHLVFMEDIGIQTHVLYGIATACVVGPVYVFQKYSHEEKIIQLGPSRSGKTSVQGGLFKSVSQPIEKESPLLDDIVEEHLNKGQFPDRTEINATDWKQYTLDLPVDDAEDEGDDKSQKTLIIEFSYVTRRNLLFPKKRTITAIDYPGELLTGLAGAPPLSSCIDAQNSDESWEDVIERWKSEPNEKDSDQFMKEFSYLVQDADWILFTAPMDDFLENLVHERPEHIPEYHRHALWRIEESEDGGEAVYEKSSVTAAESETIHARNENDGWLGNDNLYERDKNERTHPNEYLGEYTKIIDKLDDMRNHNFLWIATMADLAHEDFKAYFEYAVDADIVSDENINKIAVEDNKISIHPNSDIDPETIDGLFDESNIAPASEPYIILFSMWIQEECINEYGPHVQQRMQETFEKHVFPVWFEITDSEETEFKTDTEPVLKGSQHVLSRLNGTRLKKSYPSWAAVLSYKVGLRDGTVISRAKMGYEVLSAIKDSDVDVEPPN